MEKKSLLILLSVIIILTLISSVIALDELTQIKKGYNWLQSKTVGKWANLNTKQHVFSLLALQYKLTSSQIDSSVKALLQKSYANGTCWPGPSEFSCSTTDTALAKIVLDSVGKDSNNASLWLTNKTTTPYLNINWYLQLIQPPESEVRCLIYYDGGEHEVSIAKDGKLGGEAGSCFTIAEQYWLNLQPSCADKTFNISCNDTISANFIFKEGSNWFVTGNLVNIPQLETRPINLTTKCITQGGSCDYEATLWTAYAFTLAGKSEIARSFVPYLVMQAPNNKKFLPEAFLFRITGKSSYADYIATLQDSQGFIIAPNTAYNKYYDSSLAKMTGSAEKANLTKLKDKLLYEQKQDGSWQCSGFGCDISFVRETAMILLAFWPSFEWRSECEIMGYNCVANCTAAGGTSASYECFENQGECCNITFNCGAKYGTCKASCSTNETQVDYTCSSGVCCKNYSTSLCIAEIGGVKCSAGQECLNAQKGIIPFIYASDSLYCCKGTCSSGGGDCISQGGVYCDPTQGNSCAGNAWLGDSCCPIGKCIQGVQSCAQQYGIICEADEDCKDGQLVIASDTGGQATCCIQGGECIPQTCTYESCSEEETCVGGTVFKTSDSLKCCKDGQCLGTCHSLSGTPCNASMSCKGTTKQASDTTKCCIGQCQKKGAFPWWLVIVILVLGVAVLLFYLIKTGKIKLKGLGKPKAAQPRIEYGFPPVTRPTALPPRGLPPRQMPQRLPPRQPMPAQKPLIQKPIQPQARPVQAQHPTQPAQAQVKPVAKPVVKKKLPPPPKPSA